MDSLPSSLPIVQSVETCGVRARSSKQRRRVNCQLTTRYLSEAGQDVFCGCTSDEEQTRLGHKLEDREADHQLHAAAYFVGWKLDQVRCRKISCRIRRCYDRHFKIDGMVDRLLWLGRVVFRWAMCSKLRDGVQSLLQPLWGSSSHTTFEVVTLSSRKEVMSLSERNRRGPSASHPRMGQSL